MIVVGVVAAGRPGVWGDGEDIVWEARAKYIGGAEGLGRGKGGEAGQRKRNSKSVLGIF